ncbi:MAG: 3-deoxy-D-manno-octulosonic acid transferase [Paracoccaceae bacterium]
MAFSPGLALQLVLAAGGRPRAADRPPRPEGRLIWMHLAPGAMPGPFGQLARRLLRDSGAKTLLATGETGAPDAAAFPPGSLTGTVTVRRTGAVKDALAHWAPDLIVLAGSDLPPALIVAAHGAGVPLVLAGLRLRRRDMARWRLWRGSFAALAGRLDRIFVRDHDSALRLIRLAGTGAAPVVAGPIEETADPLRAAEAERDAMARAVGTRPVWFAAGVPEAEEEAVIAAHTLSLRLAHRMLLILLPADPARAPHLAERAAREGWTVSLRTGEGEPAADAEVLIDDGEGEYGLWYRLAPVSFMGGTLSVGSVRNPMEAAALGSAILAGPAAGGFAGAYARLSAARAFRALRTLSDLADGVGELIAADRAATLAQNAWAASTSGVESADRISGAVAALMAARAGAPGGGQGGAQAGAAKPVGRNETRARPQMAAEAQAPGAPASRAPALQARAASKPESGG